MFADTSGDSIDRRGVLHEQEHFRVIIKFRRMMNRNPPFNAKEKRFELLRRLNEIPGINLEESSIDKMPRVLLSTLASPDLVEQFLKVIEWTIDEVQKHRSENA